MSTSCLGLVSGSGCVGKLGWVATLFFPPIVSNVDCHGKASCQTDYHLYAIRVRYMLDQGWQVHIQLCDNDLFDLICKDSPPLSQVCSCLGIIVILPDSLMLLRIQLWLQKIAPQRAKLSVQTKRAGQFLLWLCNRCCCVFSLRSSTSPI